MSFRSAAVNFSPILVSGSMCLRVGMAFSPCCPHFLNNGVVCQATSPQMLC